MNRMILSGKALVLESDSMVSSDDSHCGCNCRCCFDQQAFNKTEEVCTLECGCDCACCKEHEPKLTQYWMDKKGALEEAKDLVTKFKHLNGSQNADYINLHFYDTWDHNDVNGTGLIEIERMS